MDFTQICRVCMGEFESGSMKQLFASSLDSILQQVANVKVEKGDCLPQQVCVQCVLHISRAFSLKMQCEKSDSLFRSYLVTDPCIEEGGNIKGGRIMEADTLTKLSDETGDEELEDDTETQTFYSEHEVDDLEDSKEPVFHNEDSMLIEEEIVVEEDELENDDLIEEINESEETDPKPEQVYSCKECHTFYDHPNDLQVHLRKAHFRNSENNCFECDICSKIFIEIPALQNHIKSHFPNRTPHQCTICGNLFNEKQHLTKHISTHIEEIRYSIGNSHSCYTCGQKFVLTKPLKSKQLAKQCPNCEMNMPEEKDVQIKKIIGMDVGWKLTNGLYTCLKCPERKKHHTSIANHVKKFHSAGNYFCVCGEAFPTLYCKMKHQTMERCHANKNQCTHCKKTFKHPAQLKKHLQQTDDCSNHRQ